MLAATSIAVTMQPRARACVVTAPGTAAEIEYPHPWPQVDARGDGLGQGGERRQDCVVGHLVEDVHDLVLAHDR
jgi:hypothetical protein